MEDSSNSSCDDDMEQLSSPRKYTDNPQFQDGEEGCQDSFHDEVSTIIIGSHLPLRKRKWVRWMLGVVALLITCTIGVIAWKFWDSRENAPVANAKAFLLREGITLSDAFNNQNSPQNEAIRWMIHQDPLNIDVEDPAFIQRYVAVTMVFAVVVSSPKYNLLKDDLQLLSAGHECTWNKNWESKQDDTLLDIGIRCDEAGKVNEIVMPGLGLSGELPRELGSLENLKLLVTDVNEITGSIPYVPSLTTLSMAYNNIAGPLPEYLGLMTHLQDLILSENLISGRIPEEMQDLADLRRFAITGNALKSGLHNLFHLSKLEELYGAFNSLEDGFDNDSFGRLINLRVLDLKNNKLHGPFPDALWTLPQLQLVDFHFNGLDGHLHEIEDEFLPILEYLDISINFISGGLPTTLNKVTTLQHLDVSTNRFDKPLTGDYGNLTNLKTLLLTDNSMFGPAPIPDWLKKLSNLEHLSLKLTGRTGPIPGWFFDSINQLKTLDLDWNRISGTIPSTIGRATSLEHLLLNRNWLSGTIPSVISSSLPDLKTIMVDNNRLIGQLESCQASTIVADCGDPLEGCPNCISDTMEVNCPCCTRCCYDSDEFCNTEDWLSAILEPKQADGSFFPNYYRPISDYRADDCFTPPGRP